MHVPRIVHLQLGPRPTGRRLPLPSRWGSFLRFRTSCSDRLGDARYGVWCVVESILAYFTLFDLGIAACLVRFVAKHHATGERTELNRVVSASLGLFLLAACGVLLVGGAITPFIAPGLERKLGAPGDVLPFMLLMLANLAITLPLGVFPTVLDGLQRFGAKSAVRLFCLAIRGVGIVWVMETRPGLLPLAFVYTATNLLEHSPYGDAVFAGSCPGCGCR